MKTTASDKRGIAIFMTPGLVLFLVFFAIPVLYVLVTSFMKWDGISEPVFRGLKNYQYLLKDPAFRRSVGNNVVWALVAGFVQVPLALLMALILSEKHKGWKIFRTVYFLPQVISGVALATMWSAVYNSEYGLLNAIVSLFTGSYEKTNWLGGLKTAFPAVLIFWVFYIGYYMVIMMAEIMSLDESYYEAAQIDGASPLQQKIYITLPLIKGSIVTCITLAMVFGLRQFEQVFLLTNGGPANRTSVMVLYLYNQLQSSSYGLANATGVVLIIVGTILIVGTQAIFRKGKDL